VHVQQAGTSSDRASQLWSCQNEVDPDPLLEGICVIDLETVPPIGNPDLVPAACETNSRRTIRPLGSGTPLPPAGGFAQAYYVLDCTQ